MYMQDYPTVAFTTLICACASTSNVVLEYIKGNSHGHDLLHLDQDLELRKTSLPFSTPFYSSAVKTADNCWLIQSPARSPDTLK